jgi:hypothetical protein
MRITFARDHCEQGDCKREGHARISDVAYESLTYWQNCVWNTLVNHSNNRAVCNVLETLPTEVNATYDMAMERIARQCENDRILPSVSWITHAYRPLSVEELQHALAVSLGMTAMDPDAFENALILISVCAGLVVINEESSVIRLIR